MCPGHMLEDPAVWNAGTSAVFGPYLKGGDRTVPRHPVPEAPPQTSGKNARGQRLLFTPDPPASWDSCPRLLHSGRALACIAALVDSTFFPDNVCPLETPMEVSVVDTYASRPHRHPPTGDGPP